MSTLILCVLSMIVNFPSIKSTSVFCGNYRPRTHAEFNTELQNAEKYLERLTPSEQQYYDDFRRGIVLTKDGMPNLSATATLKAYLAFKKLAKYRRIPIQTTQQNGIHDENSPFLGEFAPEYELLQKTILRGGKKLQRTYRNLFNALYNSRKLERFKMLDKCDFDAAFDIGRRMLAAEKTAHKISSDKAVTSETTVDPCAYGVLNTNVCKIYDDDNAKSDWKSVVLVDKYSRIGPLMYPRPLIKLHELYHVKQIKPGDKEASNNDFYELGATIDTIVRNDEVYKTVNNIPLDNVVSYRPMVQNQRGKSFNLGEFANKFREIKRNNNLKTYEEALITNEAINYLQNTLML